MALAPKYAALRLPLKGASGQANVHTLELFLDYVCPFSKKLFDTVYTTIQPLLASKYSSSVTVIFRPQIQPWHPSSTLTTEAALAVLKTSPERFWPFSAALFAQQTSYFDVSVVHEARNETYARLAALAGEAGADERRVLELLTVSDKPGEGGALNAGNGVTDDVKKLVKQNRLVGVHVTPTVLFDGLVENGISSGFGKAEWEEWLEKNVV